MAAFRPKNSTDAAFTLNELLVVVAVLMLAGLFVTSIQRAASRQIKRAQCAANLQQFAEATHLFAIENRDKLPEIVMPGGGWAFDMPVAVADSMIGYGMEKRTFYCPGTAPRFNDNYNFLNPAPYSLWNFFGPSGARIIGYIFAFTGPPSAPNGFNLIVSNQNTTILPEHPRINLLSVHPVPPNDERVLLADATISENKAGTAANPGPAGSFTSVVGGFQVNGVHVPHISPHLNGNLPAGGNLAYKDGHVAWREFKDMSQRASGTSRGFWW